AAKLDVVLRPDIEADEFGRAPEVDSYWGRQVVLKDVSAEYPLREQQKREEQARQRADFLTGPEQTAGASSSLPTPTTSPPGIAEQIAQLEKLQLELRDKLLAVPGEDFAAH